MNYESVLANLRSDIPGLGFIPKAPDAYPHRQMVDIHVARWQQDLVKRIPKIEIDPKRSRMPGTQRNTPRGFLADLISEGYLAVVEELNSLTEIEEKLICKGKGIDIRKQSFLGNKLILDELIVGLKLCADAHKSGDTYKGLLLRKQLAEKLITLGDYWLAKKMLDHILSCLGQSHINDENDKLRAEAWCLLSYLYIYYEDSSQELGYNLPRKYLMQARELSFKKSWYIHKSFINIVVPKPINVYGLRNDWVRIKVDYCSLHKISTILLHVLFVKKARHWQEELRNNPEERQDLCDILMNDFTSALAYADEVRQYEPFVATTLRRGLFFEELGEPVKAMEDFDAVFALTFNFDDRECLAMVMNRYGRDNKRQKKVVPALDYFAHEWEIASDNNFPELKAESLRDLGDLLLEEGDLWQADECFSHSYSLFRETKRKDTPNELEELSWAMNGVSRGMHLWSRYSGLLRTDHKYNVGHVLKWKCNRTPLPTVSHAPFRPHKRFRYDQQYTFSGENRRFFEFNRVLGSKLSELVTEEDMIDLFAFINNSRVPRKERAARDSEDDEFMALSTQRSIAAKMRAESMAFSLRRTILKEQSMLDETMTKDLQHNYKRNVWQRKHHQLHQMSIFQDPTIPLEMKLQALLKTMDDITTDSDLYVPPVTLKLSGRPKPSEAFAKPKAKSTMTPEVMEEFRKFNASEWKF